MKLKQGIKLYIKYVFNYAKKNWRELCKNLIATW